MRRYGQQGRNIIKAARTALADNPGVFSIELLCHTAGLQSETVYKFFPGEVELVLAAYRDEMTMFEHQLEATVELSSNTAPHDLSSLYAQFLADRPILCRTLLIANEQTPGALLFFERLVQSATLVTLVHQSWSGLGSDMREQHVRNTLKYLLSWICHTAPTPSPEETSTRLQHYLSM